MGRDDGGKGRWWGREDGEGGQDGGRGRKDEGGGRMERGKEGWWSEKRMVIGNGG